MVRKLSARVKVYGWVMLRIGQDGTDELEMVSFRLGGKYPWGRCPEGCKCPTFFVIISCSLPDRGPGLPACIYRYP